MFWSFSKVDSPGKLTYSDGKTIESAPIMMAKGPVIADAHKNMHTNTHATIEAIEGWRLCTGEASIMA